MTEEVLASARGDGAEDFDAPARFYLQHQRQIEEWAALGKRATEACHGWLRDHVDPAIADLGPERGLEHRYVRSGRSRNSLLLPPGTPRSGGQPVIGMGLGWSLGNVGRTSAGSGGSPHVGVWVDMSTSAGKQVREAVMEAGLRRGPRPEPAQEGEHLAGMALRPLPDDWWRDLDSAREMLIAAVTEIVDLAAEHVRSGVGSVGLA